MPCESRGELQQGDTECGQVYCGGKFGMRMTALYLNYFVK